MKERKGIVTMMSKTVTLLGNELRVGDTAPDFTIINNDLQPVTLSQYKGKVIVLSTVPSLDTSVCSKETQRIDKEAEKLKGGVEFLTISMDLPFAQKRWVGEHSIKTIVTASDHRDASFGMAYGVLMKELRLLSRTLFIVDDLGKIRYIQVVRENTNEPDYDEMLSELKKVVEGVRV
jgi:thioredoxin-dependent peroxiredoxin